jgi:fibronectin type 3 domain-containing protein
VRGPFARGLALALLLLAVVADAGCGKRGPPVAPERRLPAPPSGLAGSVEADSIVVSWTIPRVRVDGTPLRDLALIKVYRREEAPGEPARSAMVSRGEVVGWDELAAIKLDAPAPAVIAGNAGRWVDRKSLAFDRRYVYVVTVVDSTGRSSPPSERVPVVYLAAPRAPQALAAAPGEREVRLTWRPPEGLIDDGPLRGDTAYLVLRGVSTEGPLAPVKSEPVTGTTYTDTGLENEMAYRYVVRAVRRESTGTAYGEPSAVATATPVDRTAPAPPTNLLAVPSETAVRLAWTASASDDVATYGVYRAAGSGSFVRIATTPAVNTVYTDGNVRRGERYRYAVTALDRARTPNESARSNEAVVTIP